jgi:DNA-binding transcriptional ArsR family regulator
MRRDVFQAIADPSRRAIISLLADTSMTPNELAGHFEISRPAVSKHLRILMECGLVTVVQQGRERQCSARLEGLAEVANWTDQYRRFWNGKLRSLGKLLDESP